MGTPGCQQRIERCSLLTTKSLLKRIETNSSQAVGVTVKNFTLSLPLNYGGMILKTQETVYMGKNQGLKQAETIKWEHNVIAFYQFITNN